MRGVCCVPRAACCVLRVNIREHARASERARAQHRRRPLGARCVATRGVNMLMRDASPLIVCSRRPACESSSPLQKCTTRRAHLTRFLCCERLLPLTRRVAARSERRGFFRVCKSSCRRVRAYAILLKKYFLDCSSPSLANCQFWPLPHVLDEAGRRKRADNRRSASGRHAFSAAAANCARVLLLNFDRL